MTYEAVNKNQQFDPRPLGVEDDGSVDAIWEDYLASNTNHTYDAVHALWQDSKVTNPIIRQRIVTVLTAPEGVTLSYSGVDMSPRRLLSDSMGRKISERFADESELSQELASGVLYWLEATEGGIVAQSHKERESYLEIMTQLMTVTDQDTADRLFAYYPLAETIGKDDLIIGSGTHSFGDFLYSTSTAQKYKDAIFDQWSADVRRRQNDALKSMAKFVDWNGGKQNVDIELQERLVNLLEDNFASDQPYVTAYCIADIANNIASTELKFRFAQRHINRLVSDQKYGALYSEAGFTMNNSKSDRKFVEWVQAQSVQRGNEPLERWSDSRLELYKKDQRISAANEAARLAFLDSIRQV